MPTPSSLRYAHAFIRAEYCSVVQSWGTLISRVRMCVCAHRFWSRKTIWCVIYGAGRDPIQHASPLQRHNSTLVRMDVWQRACLSVLVGLFANAACLHVNKQRLTYAQTHSLSFSLSLSISLALSLALSHTHTSRARSIRSVPQNSKTTMGCWWKRYIPNKKKNLSLSLMILFFLRLSFSACTAISQPPLGWRSSPEGQVSECVFIGSLVGPQVDADICVCWIYFCLNSPPVSSRNLTYPDSLPRTKKINKKRWHGGGLPAVRPSQWWLCRCMIQTRAYVYMLIYIYI